MDIKSIKWEVCPPLQNDLQWDLNSILLNLECLSAQPCAKLAGYIRWPKRLDRFILVSCIRFTKDTLVDKKSYRQKHSENADLCKAAHYPHIAWIHDLETWHGDPDHFIKIHPWSDFWSGSQHGDLDHHQNLITCSFYHPGPPHEISSQSVYNFLSNVAYRQANRKTNKPILLKT